MVSIAEMNSVRRREYLKRTVERLVTETFVSVRFDIYYATTCKVSVGCAGVPTYFTVSWVVVGTIYATPFIYKSFDVRTNDVALNGHQQIFLEAVSFFVIITLAALHTSQRHFDTICKCLHAPTNYQCRVCFVTSILPRVDDKR